MAMFNHAAASPPQTFQTYLLRGMPFRRRKSSTDTSGTSGSISSPSSSISTSPVSPNSSISSSYSFYGFSALPVPSERSHSVDNQPSTYLNGSKSHISCSRCHADLALTSQIISKGFTGRHGRAYLVAGTSAASGETTRQGKAPETVLPNTHTHKAASRQLVTGMHTVSDISCALCGSVLGWKYVSAQEETQRYKVGKFILETRRVTVGSCWENDEYEEELEADRDHDLNAEEIAFDSQDEDECEDLFSGIWTPQLAKRRRGRRLAAKSGA